MNLLFWRKPKKEQRYSVVIHTYDGERFEYGNCTVGGSPRETVRIWTPQGYVVLKYKDVKIFEARKI